MLKLLLLFIMCCYPAVTHAKSKIDFTSTYPKEMQVLKHDVVTINCPSLSGVPRKSVVSYFFRFQKNKARVHNEVFLNRSEGQFQVNEKTGELTINDFDEQNVGRYWCVAMVTPNEEGIVYHSSALKVVIGSKQENTHQNDRLVTVGGPDDARLYQISKPTCLLKGTQTNPLLYVEWSTVLPKGVTMTSQPGGGGGSKMEEFSDFVVQMRHHVTFIEDWHNLTLIHNTHPTGPNNYHTTITNLETGYGQYRILGLTNNGRSVQSPLSDGLTVPGSSSHHHSPGEGSVVDSGGVMSVVPVISTLVSISETSVLLEWKMEPNYDVTGIVDRFIVVYRRVQTSYDSSHNANNNPSFNSVSGSDPHSSSLTHPWEQDVHVDNPNRRSCVVTNLLVNTKYQFTLEAVGPHGIKSSSQPKIIVTGIGAGPWTDAGPTKEPRDDKESGMMMMLVIGGCVSVVLVAIVISVSILLLYKQRLNNNITNKVIMREMEEELKRRENSLRKSTNIEQGSLLGSGCSEHSVNSSPIGMDEQAYMQHHNLQGHPQIAIIQPTSGGIRQPSTTPPISAQALPSVLAVSGAGPFRAQPNVYEYNTSAMPNPNSIYNTSNLGNMTSMASSFHPIAEIRGPLIHSNMSSPVTTIALPQPLKTLNSPALIAKYTTGNVPLAHQNTYTSPGTGGHQEPPDFASSFKNLKDLSASGNSDMSNPGAGFSSSTLSRPLRGQMGPKTSGASNSLSQRNSIHNYTIEEDELGANGSTMSNYQALPSAGEQLNSSGISQT